MELYTILITMALYSLTLSPVISVQNIPIGDRRCTPMLQLMQPPIVLTLPLMDCFLAPTSLFYENQTLSILVVNRLERETTSIHWHGMHQNNTPWMDGVEHVTPVWYSSQCFISLHLQSISKWHTLVPLSHSDPADRWRVWSPCGSGEKQTRNCSWARWVLWWTWESHVHYTRLVPQTRTWVYAYCRFKQ